MDIDEIRVVISGDASGLSRTIGQVESELSRLENAQSSAGAAGQRAARQTENSWQKAGKGLKDLGSGIDDVAKPLYVTSAAMAAGGFAAAKFAIDFEDSFAAVKKTVDGTPEQLAEIKQSLIDMTTVGINGHSAIPLTTAELTELAAAGGQLGIATENIADFTETMAMLETATNLQGEQGAATLARYMNVMQMSQDEISNLGSAIVDLGNNSATTEAEIAEMALRMGKFGNTVGMSAADVLGYSAALSSMGVEAQAGGSAVGRTWLSIEQAVASGGKDLKKFAKYSGKSAKEFKEQWSTDPKGAFNGLLKGLKAADNLTLALDEIGVNNTLDKTAMQALVNGFDLVEESVNRANTAYKENTALQTEFAAKAETTASKIQVAKNNLVEAARSIGEIMLPTLQDVTGGIAGFAQGLAKLDDGTKKNIIGIGAAFIGLGAATKGVASGIKTVGGVVEGIGKIEEATADGGALAKLAPLLGSIGSTLGPIALGVGAVTAAVVVGKAAYDSWYNSTYKFADGLVKQADALSDTRKQWKSLNDLRWEYNDLSDKINSKSLAGEELKAAQSRLDEIVKILKDEYKIDVDSGDIDDAIAKAQELEKYKAQGQETQLQKEFKDKRGNYDNAVRELPKAKKAYDEATASAEKYEAAQRKIADIDEEFAYKDMTNSENLALYTSKIKEVMSDAGMTTWLANMGQIKDKTQLAASATLALSGAVKSLDIDGKQDSMEGYEKAIEQYKQTAESLADVNLDKFTNALKAGADGTKYLDRIAEYAKDSLIDADEFARKAALITSGQDSINQMFEQGEQSVSSYVTDYVGKMQLFGASNEQIQTGLNSLAEAYTKWLDDAEKLPENTHVEFTADGEVIFVPNTDKVDNYNPEEKSATAKYTPETSAVDAWTPPPKVGTVNYHAVMGDGSSLFNKLPTAWAKPKATGTDYFPGGLAMVNDQKGIADPRELIVDKGRAFIPEGRDVILPLSKGAKVYTAAETKRIMAGIPHYAGGKDNSDAFTKARDDWQYYTRTHAVTTAQELEKWVEFSEKYKSNAKDIADIEEQIYSLRVKLNDEMNKTSKAYIEEHMALDDWDEIGDNAIDAINRVRDRNLEEVAAGRMTWTEFTDTMKSLGSSMYSNLISQSKKHLDHEEKYRGMSTDNYIAGIEDMKATTEAWYKQGIISYREYVEGLMELDDMRYDNYAKKYDEMLELSNSFADEHTYFNDWNDPGNDPIAAWERVRDREFGAVGNGRTEAEAKKNVADYGSKLFQGRLSQSYSWLDEQSKYFDLSDEKYIEGLKRMQKYTQKYLDEGMIGRVEYHKAITELNHQIWDKQEDILNEGLQKQREEIDKIKQQFQDEEQALRDSWTVDDRRESIADLTEKVRLWQGAVTERGQEQLKQYQEQLKQAQREEQLYQLQVRDNATIEEMERQYKLAEDNKKVLLRGIRSEVVDAQKAVNTLVDSVENNNSNLETLLGRIEKAIYSIETGNTTTNNYNDNRKQTTITKNSNYGIGEIANGRWLSSQ